jgi:branched-chain amino acid aminotransferase
MQEYAYVNLTLVAKEHASFPINDLALLRGYGVFDFFLLAKGLPLFFEDHWLRLNRSAKAMHLQVPFTREELLAMIAGLFEKMPVAFGGVRVTLTGGSSPDGYSLGAQPNSLITLQPLSMFPDNMPEKGFGLMTHAYRRAMPHVKSIDYSMGIMMLQEARAKGFDDVLFVQDGWVSECPRANIFGVTEQGILITPDTGVLEGITRMRVLNIARHHLSIEVKPLSLEMLLNCREVFISSSTKGIMPITCIDETLIGNGEDWAVSKSLYLELKAQVDSAFY